MKSLQESLFDKDLVEKPAGHQLNDIAFFDGQWVYRVVEPTRKKLDIKGNNALEVIDWKKVRKDLKKIGGDKIDLGLYAYASADKHIIRNTETNKKTEDFARLILSIPYGEEYYWGGFNSRFRDEFEPLLDSYILPQKRTQQSGDIRSGWYWEIDCRSRFGFNITLHFNESTHYYGEGAGVEWLRFEFIKRSDDQL